MKALGNLAIVCARRDDCLLQIRDGVVNVYIKNGPERTGHICKTDDDDAIEKIIKELNFGTEYL